MPRSDNREDPLEELARLVSGRSPLEPRAFPAPRSGRANELEEEMGRLLRGMVGDGPAAEKQEAVQEVSTDGTHDLFVLPRLLGKTREQKLDDAFLIRSTELIGRTAFRPR